MSERHAFMTMFSRRKLVVLSSLGLGFLAVGREAKSNSTGTGPMTMKRGYTDCRFGQLHYIHGTPTEGGSDKPVLVMLHQNPSSSVEYEPLIREMATDREVYAFDTPGNGMSDWPPEPQDMPGYAAAFADGMTNLGLGNDRPVDVFGFHTGTLLAAELSIAEPDRVGRLVISGIPYRSEEERQDRLDAIEARPRITEDGKAIMGQIERLWNFVVTQRDQRVPLQRAATVFMEKAKPMDRYWWPYRSVWSYDFVDRFPRITQPTLILQPHENLLESSLRAAELLQSVEIVEMPDLKRDVFDVGSDQIAEAMRAFLT